MENEVWKDVVGYEGLYKVSNLGRVKSCERKVPGRNGNMRLIKERILNKTCTRKDITGYNSSKRVRNKIRRYIA